jgi:hydroxymethylpyrimidine pyrophosphatase-like HAD family hydrolase
MSYIAVDLDGTLATYNKGDYHKKGPTFIGAPIPAMVELVLNRIIQKHKILI